MQGERKNEERSNIVGSSDLEIDYMAQSHMSHYDKLDLVDPAY